MIIFEKEQLTIIIKDADIAERWVNMVDELLDLLYCKNEDFIRQHQNVLLLLQELMPDWKQTKAMIDVKPEGKSANQLESIFKTKCAEFWREEQKK